jgi:hypothetical protein
VFCPICGEDAGDEERCPSCDADLTGVRDVSAGAAEKTGGKSRAAATGSSSGAKTPGRGDGAGAAAGAAARSGGTKAAAGRGRSALRRWLPWTIAALVVIVAVVVVVVGPGGGDATTPASQGGGSDGGSAVVGEPEADTRGAYDALVQRANSTYDDGVELFQDGRADEAAKYFAAAAEIYAAAWEQQPGDPNVGTDWATSLFYAGDIGAAIERVDKVLAENPTFQPGLYNRGNYLVHSARVLEAEGDTAGAAKARKEAAAAFRAAIDIDAESDVGKAAAERLKGIESEQ